MLHRGSTNKLTSTMNALPAFSVFLVLLLQSQILLALPTSSSDRVTIDLSSDVAQKSPSPSTSYSPTFSYSSYRPGAGLDSYRPYRNYYPKDDLPSGLYLDSHPNSIYSSQSPFTNPPRNFNKFQFIEKEVVSERQQSPVEEVTFRISLPKKNHEGHKHVVPLQTRSNKPRLAPLPSVDEVKVKKDFVEKVEEKKETRLEPLPSNPIPPPFAPELDPQYERRQFGLGALTLLDQAGPFW